MRWLLSPDKAARALVKRLHRDEGGNIIVLYIAAALLLVGMLWAIIGTGARMVQKETIQSSADAAAFSAAVIKAKGLNIIAFCNLVMAILLAIIMLLRLIKGALLILVGITLAACFDIFGGEILCGFNPTADQLYSKYSQLESQLEPKIMDAMKGMAKLERVVNKTFPALSLVEAYRVGTHDVYKRNMGGGSLVTVTWPLPIGKDLSLPTKDGTWDELCNQALNMIDDLLQVAMTKIGLPSFVAGIFGDGVKMLLTPLKGLLCGSGGGAPVMIDQQTREYDCSKCNNATATILIGQKRVPGPPSNPGQFAWQSGQQCKEDYFDSSWCGGKVQWLSDCNGGDSFQWLTFDSCLVTQKQPADNGAALTDKPLPLDLADDWESRKNVRAFTLLTSTNMDQRRQSVGIATKDKGSAPFFDKMIGTAQAEFYGFNGPGHEDLWHMDWRARLVRFEFTNGGESGSDTGDAAGSGGPSGDQASGVLSAINNFVSTNGSAALADQFLLH